MRAWLRLIGVAVCLLVLSGCISAPGPATIGGRGLWTINTLGSPGVAIEQPSNARVPIATYSLPRNAVQGEGNWYLLKLHFRVALAEDSGPGRVYLSASTNQRDAAQIRFDVLNSGAGSLTRWDTLDLINGNAEFFTLSPIIEAEFTNYLQSMGVRPGPNELSVAVETHGQAKVQSISILDDSGIEVTDLAPPKVKLDIVTPDHLVGVGDAFNLGFRLTNQGGFPAKNVTVRVVYPSGALRALTGEEEQFALIEREARGQFTLEALKPGSHKLFVVVSSQSGGQALVAVEAEIGDAAQERIAATSPETSSWPAASLQEWHRLAAAVLGTASLLLLTRGLRRPGSGGSAKR